jgi:glycosyltransferase involved in cell wall biosynthesis
VEVVYQGIDVDSWGERRPGPPDRPARLLSVAALREKKGHHVLLRAMTAVPGAELTIVGEGPERPRLESLIDRLGLRDRVALVGAEPPARVRERMAEADLFALACVRARNGDLDGVPISLMEAMAAGVPVVSTAISGVPELIEDGEEGLLAPPGDAEALAARIRGLLDDPEHALRLARSAREKVRRQHDARRSVGRLAGLLADPGRGWEREPEAATGRRTRIVVNTLSVVPGKVGGGETYLVNLVRAMGARLGPGEELHLVCTRGNADLFPSHAGVVSRTVLPLALTSRPARLAAEHLLLPMLLRASRADVLLSPGNALPPLAGVRHVLALQSMHYRFVAHQMSRSRVAYFRKMVPISVARAARVVCVSRDLFRSLLEAAPRAALKARVVHEGTDLEAFAPGPEPGPGAPVLYVSSLNPFKRPDSVVRALGLLRREGFEPPPVRMVGRPDAPDRDRVEDLARREGVEDLVLIEGVVAHEALPALYRSAVCLVYPSIVETFGLPPLEAMACGCPVVASNRTSVPEVVGDAALVVDPDDVPALAAAIRRVIEDVDLRADLRRRGFENVRRFTWDRAARETLAAIREASEPR